MTTQYFRPNVILSGSNSAIANRDDKVKGIYIFSNSSKKIQIKSNEKQTSQLVTIMRKSAEFETKSIKQPIHFSQHQFNIHLRYAE